MDKSKYSNLVWSEEFDNGINPDVWGYEIGYVRNHELQYYSDRANNARTENGKLIIEAHLEDYKGFKYTSASLNTQKKQDFLFGRLEMCAKLPKGKGVWPAFWTLGSDYNITDRWPHCGEIDIMEMVGGTEGDKTIYVNLHYAKNGKHTATSGNNTHTLDKTFGDSFHIFGMLWDEENIEFYVDDVSVQNYDIREIDCFRKPQYILVNLAIGGDWPGEPDENTIFPQRYEIDWIRYYK